MHHLTIAKAIGATQLMKFNERFGGHMMTADERTYTLAVRTEHFIEVREKAEELKVYSEDPAFWEAHHAQFDNSED